MQFVNGFDVSSFKFQDAGHMSFQRIIETARRLGTPVIISDVAGREPMVLLPLDVFEALSSGSRIPEGISSKAEPTIEPTISIPRSFDESAASPKTNFGSETTVQTPTEAGNELSMEERFYLEPLEEDAK